MEYLLNNENRNKKNKIITNKILNKNKLIHSSKPQKEIFTYSIVDFPTSGNLYGKFKAKSPKRAANKAFTKLAKMSKLNNASRDFIKFTIKNNQTKKEYDYIGKRIKLDKPITIMTNGVKITYKYINTVGKYKKELNKL